MDPPEPVYPVFAPRPRSRRAGGPRPVHTRRVMRITSASRRPCDDGSRWNAKRASGETPLAVNCRSIGPAKERAMTTRNADDRSQPKVVTLQLSRDTIQELTDNE